MAEPGRTAAAPGPAAREPWPRRAVRTASKRWRVWLRSVHRDVGYLAVGLTVVYAVSGLAINHIGSWDPNFRSITETAPLAALPRADAEAAAQLTAQFGVTAPIRDSYWDSDTAFEVKLDSGVIRGDSETGLATYVHEEERFFLRVSNWLHLNRGKAAWTYIADGYAIFLLFLAMSGSFMLKGGKGILGRGGILIAIGAAVPIVYVQLSGGP